MTLIAPNPLNPSLIAAETEHFAKLAGEWWSNSGPFATLHAFNPARLEFIVREVAGWRGAAKSAFKALEGLSVLDVGCGGGILSEPLARLGGSVTGIDPIQTSIEIAKAHAAKQNLDVCYRAATAEDLVREGARFDVVIASEVIEHVGDVGGFLSTLRALTKPQGLLVLSTLNRTAKSYALSIVAAERIFGLIPRGTHDWQKFLKPKELAEKLNTAGFAAGAAQGIVLNPLSGRWALSARDTSINYILSARAHP